MRAGEGLDRFYSPDYVGIHHVGAVADVKAVTALKPDPNFAVGYDIAVRMSENGAITTGTQRVEEAGIAIRFLRVGRNNLTGGGAGACSQDERVHIRGPFCSDAG